MSFRVKYIHEDKEETSKNIFSSRLKAFKMLNFLKEYGLAIKSIRFIKEPE